jgi:hypothetical protein
MESTAEIRKAHPGATCRREIRLDPAGKPVYCPSKAVLVINGKAFCQKHAKEAMDYIALVERAT